MGASSKGLTDRLLQDLRYAARSLVKDPGFTALTILCLALGIGVNSTIFSLADTVAIRPRPFRDPGELVRLAATNQANGNGRAAVSPLDFRDWNRHACSRISPASTDAAS